MSRDGGASGGSPAGFDFARLASISDGDAEFEREICGEYLAQARELLTQIAAATAAGDTVALRRAAHTLKGSSRTIGAEAVATVTAEIERDPGGEKYPAGSACLDKLRAGLAAVERTLDGYFGTDAYRKAA